MIVHSGTRAPTIPRLVTRTTGTHGLVRSDLRTAMAGNKGSGEWGVRGRNKRVGFSVRCRAEQVFHAVSPNNLSALSELMFLNSRRNFFRNFFWQKRQCISSPMFMKARRIAEI